MQPSSPPCSESSPAACPGRRRAPLPALAALAVVAASFEGGSAHGDTGRLRGIAADLAAARMLEQVERADTEREELDIELAQVTARRLQTEQSLRTRLRSLYRITRAGRAPVSGGFEAIRSHVARVKRMSALVRSDLRTLRGVEARERSLREEASRHADALRRAREEVGGTHQPLAAGGAGLPLAAADAAGPRPRSDSGFYGLRLADPSEAGDFSARHGRLATPVAGEVRVVDARRSESQGSGLEFQAPAGTSVRAAAPGRVAFSDRYGSYGRLVILDHGAGYYTAYGGLGGVDVRVGDEVSAFARLGAIGGDSRTPALYFEVRKGTKTLAPRAWLGM